MLEVLHHYLLAIVGSFLFFFSFFVNLMETIMVMDEAKIKDSLIEQRKFFY